MTPARTGAEPGAAIPGSTGSSRVFPIASEEDRLWASGEARRFAASLGFGREDQARIAVCVAELASNMAKHAIRGVIALEELPPPERGCRVRAEDHGPGIPALEEALRDGFSEGRWLTPDVPASDRRGLGVGLGAVCRMMDDVRFRPGTGGGLVIVAELRRKTDRLSGTRR